MTKGISQTGPDTNGNCVEGSTTSDTSTCVAVACSSEGGSGPPPSNPVACNPCNGDEGPGCCSPVVIDTTGHGYFLTSASNGVSFDISADGIPIQIAWTAPGSGDAFLALPGADGLVHNGGNLFGSGSPQPPSAHPNGFAALAVYDLPANGGNGDGIIDARDAIWTSLRLWIDVNHDGICQPEEMHTLPSLGVNSISLKYREDRKTDQYGNEFRYRAGVDPNDPDPTHVGRTAYDVFFVTLNPIAKNKNCPQPPKGATQGSVPSATGTGNLR
ncbi:MAG: hypothetical protein WCD43_06485 [Candidatus Acidiferrales bacterium]